MRRRGNYCDNGVAESVFASLKTEEGQQPYDNQASAYQAIARAIHGVSISTRLHS